MQKRYRWLMLNQLDETLSQLKPLLSLQRPPTGWIRAIRETLGMSARQMAKRLSVSPPRVTRLEADETDGKVTVNTLKRTAEALDCVFVYGFVPKTSLEHKVRTQAVKIASERVAYVSHSMQLEDQKLSTELLKQEVDNAVEEILRTWPRTLWDMSNETSESKRHHPTN
jgi:predicted DNA-binding mobile mystery protein A